MRVTVTETIEHTFDVRADDRKEAREKAMEEMTVYGPPKGCYSAVTERYVQVQG